MKALIISNLTRKFQAGHYSMIDPLKDLGFEVTWAANFDEYVGSLDNFDFEIQHIDFDRNPFNTKNIKAYKQLQKLVKEQRYDLIHCQSPIGGVLGRIVGSQLNVPVVIYTAHGLHFFKGAPQVNFLVYKNVEKYLAKKTDAIIVMNNEDFNSIQSFKLKSSQSNHFKIHGMGVDISISKINDNEKYQIKESLPFEVKPENKIIISMGDLIERKDYSTAIEGVAKFIKANNRYDTHYIICGEGPEYGKLSEMIKDLNMTKNIHLLGFRDDIASLLSIADIFLFSSKQEGLPRSLMEAMSNKLLCIVSDIRGNNDLIKDGKGGHLFEVGDFDSIATILYESIDSLYIRDKYYDYNKEVLELYRVENVKNEMKEIYETVLS